MAHGGWSTHDCRTSLHILPNSSALVISFTYLQRAQSDSGVCMYVYMCMYMCVHEWQGILSVTKIIIIIISMSFLIMSIYKMTFYRAGPKLPNL